MIYIEYRIMFFALKIALLVFVSLCQTVGNNDFLFTKLFRNFMGLFVFFLCLASVYFTKMSFNYVVLRMFLVVVLGGWLYYLGTKNISRNYDRRETINYLDKKSRYDRVLIRITGLKIFGLSVSPRILYFLFVVFGFFS